MNPLRFVVTAFVNTFGITQPEPREETRAGLYISAMLLILLAMLVIGAWLLHGAFSH